MEGDLSMVKRKWSKVEIEEYRNTQGVFFYCNNEDSNLFVPKGFGIGWTVIGLTQFHGFLL